MSFEKKAGSLFLIHCDWSLVWSVTAALVWPATAALLVCPKISFFYVLGIDVWKSARGVDRFLLVPIVISGVSFRLADLYG